MSIISTYTRRDSKLGAKIFNMALARSSFGMESRNNLQNEAMDSLCIDELNKSFEPYRKKYITNGFGNIELTAIVDRSSALIFAYRCGHKAMKI